MRESIPIPVFPGMELSLESGHVNLIFDNSESILKQLSKISEQIYLVEFYLLRP